MLIRTLIEKLEQLEKEHEPHKHIMGEADIMIDSFDWSNRSYKGYDHDIRIERSDDGVYLILTSGAAADKWRGIDVN